MTKRETQKADYEAEVTDNGFDKAAYEQRLRELQRMTPPTQTCSLRRSEVATTKTGNATSASLQIGGDVECLES